MGATTRRGIPGKIAVAGGVWLTCITVASMFASAANPAFLKRSVCQIQEQSIDLSSRTAHYKPIFGVGDPNVEDVKGIVLFGELTVEPAGSSKMASYEDIEGVFFILAGSGVLHYGQEKVPIKHNDFVYLPLGVEHGISNQSEKPLRLLVMGFKIPAGVEAPPTPERMMANADNVPPQVLASHGPTTQFKLLMGTTKSKRDKLAAAQQINSLFLMDFAAGGTNIPHRHKKEEEIYYVLRGHGDMVAGNSAAKKEIRYPSQQGDAFYFASGTLIGFYSGMENGEQHAQILAVRWPVPSVKSEKSPDDVGKK
ncbi:MAG: cupin domain-containing protein [Desulfobacterales bacterium]|nr:MAG: cupin domain-containing protein [Desulfobacterales bacterium]